MRSSVALIPFVLLAGCVAVPSGQPGRSVPPPPREAREVPPTKPRQPVPQGFIAPQILHMPGLEDVIEKNATALVNLFGQPQLDVHEGDMRKLQFAGPACVLDVFLYPLRPGAEPVATYVDARRASDGLDVNRAACVAALRR